MVEDATLDADGRPAVGYDAVATRHYRYDTAGRQAVVSCLGADGMPVTSYDGYAKSITDYDEASHVESTRFLGVDGEPVAGRDGYASVKRKRDLWWNIVEEHYYDEYGDPTITTGGYAGWRGTFDARNQEVERVFLGKTDEVVVGKDGYAYWRAEYDDLGRRTGLRYLDPLGKPEANATDGVAGWRARYDGWGREIEHDHLGLDGKPVDSTHGEAGWRAEYDSRGNQTRLRYVDVNGSSTLHAWDDAANFTGTGYALLTRAYDAHGRLTQQAYFGVHEERVVQSGGYSYLTNIYDELGHRIRQSYYGAQSEPVKSEGFHTVVWVYDERGNAVELRYLDNDDKTDVISDERFGRLVWAYDQNRNIVEERVFGRHGERVVGNSGAYRTVWKRDDHGRPLRVEHWGPEEPPNLVGAIDYSYDAWGNKVAERHVDVRDQPVELPRVCSTRRWRYSDRQELLEDMCQGIDGSLTPRLNNGAARIVYSYGRPGEKIGEMYFDAHGGPFTVEQGYAAIRYRNDLLGRVTETTYVDALGHQAPTRLGYARATYAYDLRGDIVERAYFMADDRPMLPVSKMQSEFDALRRKVKDRYLGPGSKPTRLGGHLGNGQHETLYAYDDYGNVRELHYLDPRGQPTFGYARMLDPTWQLCARWLAHYDLDGKLTGNGDCRRDLTPEDGETVWFTSRDRIGVAK